MPVTVDPNKILSGQPGVLYAAPLGTALPLNTVAGSVFTDAWAAPWVPLGPTDSGTALNHAATTANVEVAEQIEPVKIVTTGRADSIAFALAHFTLGNYKLALNGGQLTVTGTGATQLNEYAPPDAGAEVRTMLGWQSDDSTIRLVCFQCFQTGNVAPSFDKGVAKAVLACTFGMEKPGTGPNFKLWTAGANRA